MASKHPADSAIAIVGASALYPGSLDGQRFWDNILEGRDFIDDVPEGHWLVDDYYAPEPATPGRIYADRGGFLPKVPFDPLQYGVPPNQLSSTDTAQLLSLIVAEKVLDDALSFQFGKVSRRDVSVILGVASATELVAQMAARIQRPHWIKALRDAGLPESQVDDICDRIEATYPEWNESTFPGLLGNVVAGRIANRLDLGGTNCVIDAACASSLGAVAMGIQELQLGHSDLVITGGADTLNDTFMFMCFSQTPALSRTGDCRPFSEAADGTMLGEGIGMVALRRLQDAERDGDRIYGVIRGLGSSSDGRAKSIYAPRPEGQEIALQRAYERAGYDPGEVELVEAHGTATMAGDAAEFDGLCRAFARADRDDRQWCALGSIKSQIGHTKAAAGAASLFKVVMALHHKVLPPTIKVEQPSSRLDFANSPFYLNTRPRPWIRPSGLTRKGSVSSFGFGGSNFHVTLEEYVGPAAPAARFASLPVHLLLLSGDDAGALQEAFAATLQRLEGGASLAALARESQLEFDAGASCRLALLGADADAVLTVASTVRSHLDQRPDQSLSMPGRVHYLPDAGEISAGDIAFLFPGQGSQYPDMGAEVAMAFDDARRVWDDTAELWQHDALPLHQVVFPQPVFSDEARQRQQEQLTRTDRAQPAIGTVSLSLLRLLERVGVRPDAVAGHSYGEISALHAAGAIPSAHAMLAISRRRGELMHQSEGEPGAMLAVQADADAVTAQLQQAELAEALTLANLNGPTQTVVAGPAEAVERLAEQLKAQQLRCSRLPVAKAFHTEQVAGCAEPLAEFLAECRLQAPALPVYGNTSAAPYPEEPAAMRQQLAEQLARPVRFADMLERMYNDGCRLFVEVGPGATLTGMVTDCLGDRPHLAVATDQRRQDGRAALMNALAVLSAAGIKVDYGAFWSEFAPFPNPEDEPAPSAAAVHLNGSNHGKPYPPAEGAAARPAPNPEPKEEPSPMTTPRHQPDPAPAADAGHAARTPAAQSPPPTPAAPAAAPVATAGPSPEWAASFAEIQRSTLEAQQAYTRALSESHQAFLRATEVAFAQLGQLSGGAAAAPAPARMEVPVDPARASTTAAAAAGAPEPPAATAAPAAGSPAAGSPAAGPPTPEPSQPAPAPAAQASAAAAEPVAARPASAPAPAPEAATDPEALLFAVVAEKTGYPTEMLGLDMELEAGLGIDSIKRVEILSVLQEQIPELADIDPAELASLNTLGEIVDFARETMPQAQKAPARTPAAESAGASPPTSADVDPAGQSAGGPADHEALLLQVVAEKTGYPTEMLSMDMELEAGLGIDSIKRVEILSVLQEQVPELADIDPAELASLNTLGEIVDFARQVTGTEAPTAKKPEPGVVAAAPALTRRVVALQRRTAPGFMTPGLDRAAPLFIVASPPQQPLAQALSAWLKQHQVASKVVEAVPAEPQALLLLTGVGQETAEAALQCNERLFRQLQDCAAYMASQGQLLITVQDTGGDFGIGAAAGDAVWAAGVGAAAKTAALEWPQVQVRAIDLAARELGLEAAAALLGRELLTGGAAREVGLSSAGRVVPELVEGVTAPQPAPAFATDDVIVVSGGARGVTTECLQALMGQGPARLALLGRTRLQSEPEELQRLTTDAELKQHLLQQYRARGEQVTPRALGDEVGQILAQRELQAGLEWLRASGAEVHYFPLDIADRAQVEATLERIRAELGPVRGLIHAAGVLADKPIAGKTLEQFRRVFRTKVEGLRNLLAATASDPLQQLVCFSSVAARTGNAGQVDYAMANEILNRVCRQEAARRGDDCVVKAIGWGPWAGGMVDAGLQQHFERMGISLIPLAAGAAWFADEVTGRNGPGVEMVVGGGLDRFGAAAGPVAGDAVTRTLHFQPGLTPLLDSHCFRGEPLVPMVMVMDLACAAVREHWPDARITGCRQVQVGQGIRLPASGAEALRCQLHCERDAAASAVTVRLTGADGSDCYRLQVELDGPSPSPASLTEALGDLQAWTPAGDRIYDGRLFHGPELQSIAALDRIGAGGATGWLQPCAATSPGVMAPLDVLDGGLQLALLWVHEHDRCESLPTGLDRLWLAADWPDSGPVFCQLHCRQHRSLGSRWQLRWQDDEGRLLAAIDDLRLHHLMRQAGDPVVANPQTGS